MSSRGRCDSSCVVGARVVDDDDLGDRSLRNSSEHVLDGRFFVKGGDNDSGLHSDSLRPLAIVSNATRALSLVALVMPIHPQSVEFLNRLTQRRVAVKACRQLSRQRAVSDA